MTRRPLLLILTCLVAGVLPLCAFGQTSAKLEYKFIVGETLRYKVSLDMVVSSKSSFNQTGKSAPTGVKIAGMRDQTVKQVFPNGDAEILYKYENMKIGDGNNWQDTPSSELPVLSMIVSKDGTVKSVNGMEKLGPVAQLPFLNIENLDQCLTMLPTILPKDGEKWTQNTPLPKSSDSDSTGSMQVAGGIISASQSAGGLDAVRYGQTVDGKQAFLRDGSPVAKTLVEHGTVQAKVENLFSPKLGHMLQSQGTGLVKTFMDYKNDDVSPVVGRVSTGIQVKYLVILQINGK